MEQKLAISSAQRRISGLDSFVHLEGGESDGGEIDLIELHLFLYSSENICRSTKLNAAAWSKKCFVILKYGSGS